jgi:hypothetical protein
MSMFAPHVAFWFLAGLLLPGPAMVRQTVQPSGWRDLVSRAAVAGPILARAGRGQNLLASGNFGCVVTPIVWNPTRFEPVGDDVEKADSDGSKWATEPAVRDFLVQHDIPQRDDIIAAFQEAHVRALSIREGHVVIGQLALPPGCALDDLACHVIVLPDGYFVDAVQTPGIPLWFWHPRCAVAEVIPQASGRAPEWLGKVELERSQDRATVRGLGRVSQFEIPDQFAVTAEYSLGFVNSAGFAVKKMQALEAHLGEIAKPSIEVDTQTGQFEITGLLNAPIQLNLFSSGSKDFSLVVHPSMSQPVDLGVCELRNDSNPGPSPTVKDVPPAENGRPTLDKLLQQIQQQSGNYRSAVLFADHLSKKLEKLADDAREWNETNGARSAVALFITVAIPNTDLSLLKTQLNVSEAIYSPRDNPSAPRIVFGLVKPGTTVRVSLPGYSAFEYQTRGSNDGVEVVAANFKPLSRRHFASGRGKLARVSEWKSDAFDLRLVHKAWPHITPNGLPPQDTGKQQSSDGYQISTRNAEIDLPQLQPGAYTLRISGAPNEWPREIPFVVEPRQRIRLPATTLYAMPAVQIETAYISNSGGSDRPRTLREAKPETHTLDFTSNNAVPGPNPNRFVMSAVKVGNLKRWGMTTQQSMAGSLGGLRWSISPLGGNSLAVIPFLSPGWSGFDEPQGWSVLRLGTGTLSDYQSIEAELGGTKERAKPTIQRTQDAPFQLVRGYTYLIQHHRGAYVILVRISE